MSKKLDDQEKAIVRSLIRNPRASDNAIAKITRAVIAEMPINDYAVIEQIFDHLGAEKYLQTLFIKEMQNNL